jgi:hypothetical protein
MPEAKKRPPLQYMTPTTVNEAYKNACTLHPREKLKKFRSLCDNAAVLFKGTEDISIKD